MLEITRPPLATTHLTFGGECAVTDHKLPKNTQRHLWFFVAHFYRRVQSYSRRWPV